MREGMAQHHRHRIYHQHPMPYPHYRVEHQLWDKNSRSREARTEETAFSACETPDFFRGLGLRHCGRGGKCPAGSATPPCERHAGIKKTQHPTEFFKTLRLTVVGHGG